MLSLLESGNDLLSRAVSSQVPSTLKGLTSVFGMGTGGTPSLLSPEMVSFYISFALSDFCLSTSSSMLRIYIRLLSPSDSSSGSFRLPRTLTTAHFQALSLSFFHPWSLKTSARPISNDNLHALPRFQRRPIYLLVFQGSHGNLILVVGFTLRCFQRLSRPYFASQLCPWQDNCCTSGTSTPVLSY